MIDFFDKLYVINNKNIILNKIKFYAMWRRIVTLFANIILPIYFLVTHKNKNNALNNNNDEVRCIVSLTTFPLRITRLWLVIESLLRQKIKPDKIILWLSENEFSSYDKLPFLLRQQTKRGLDIRFKSGNILSHKKYFYCFSEYPDSVIITYDDDILYPSNSLSKLIAFNKQYPNAVVCNRAWKIKYDKVSNQLLPYNQWEFAEQESLPDVNIFATGVGGILYPPNILSKEVLNFDVMQSTCPYADDIWLNAMALINDKSCTKTDDKHINYLPVLFLKNIKLTQRNVHNNGNDYQIRKIRDYYLINKKIDIYKRIIESE